MPTSSSSAPTATSSPAGFTRLQEFSEYFDLSPATSLEQRNQVFQIRYRVYCEEFGYESTDAFRDHLEKDEFDHRSVHCLVTHKATGVPVGCVRVVMVDGDELLPMELHAGDSIDQDFFDSFRERRDCVCEISRLAVDGNFRRRRREKESPVGNIDSIGANEWEQRTYPLIAVSLMIGAGAMAEVLGRKHCFAIMEPVLPVMMRRAGIHFHRAGTNFEYRGMRAPYYGNMDELFERAPAEFCLYFNALRERFTEALQAAPTMQLPMDTPVEPPPPRQWMGHYEA